MNLTDSGKVLKLTWRVQKIQRGKVPELKEQSQNQQLEDEFKRMMGQKVQEQQVEQSKSGKNL